jgi:hypothetical protein
MLNNSRPVESAAVAAVVVAVAAVAAAGTR